MHAASVGEAKVICSLVEYLRKSSPDLKIHLTTMTSTGFEMASKQCTSKGVTFSYFPIDTPGAVKRTLDALEPRMIVVAETEIWPCLVRSAYRREIPIVLANARMSAKAFKRYKYIAGFMARLLQKYDRFFFKTTEDAERYRQFGVSEARGVVAGDMKFDAPIQPRTPESVARIRKTVQVPDDAFLIVAGSTRPGEEALLLDVYRRLHEEIPDIYLIIAPRHIERSDEIRSLFGDKGVAYRTYGDSGNGEHLILVDRLGLLNELYQAASISFVGGTLVDLGGHNLLEPVWAGSPVLFGPSLGNVAEAAAYIQRHNYGGLVKDSDELYSVLKKAADGDILYATKKTSSPENSATAAAGDYILSRLSHV
jgi:3-deoxy-D-manno-octulosonic-acid transferase